MSQKQYTIATMSQKTLFIETLKKSGNSITASRSLVFGLLEGSEPLTMRELTLAASSIDRASLYRCIALFEQLGIVQRLYIGWKYKIELTDLYSHHHHHISCLGCGAVVAVDDHPQLETIVNNMAAQTGFALSRHQLELQGYCQKCQKITV